MLQPLHLAAVIGINVVFAGAYIAGKFGVNHFPPLFFSALRFMLVFIALAPFFRWNPVPRRSLVPFLGFCFSMGVGVYSTMYLALSLADGVSAILIGTQFSVPIAVLLGVLMRGDVIGPRAWAGILIAFSGALIVGFDRVILGYGLAFSLIVLSAFFYAYANVLSQQLGGVINVLNLNAWMALLAIPPMLLLSLLFEGQHWQFIADADSSAWLALLYSSVIVSLIGHVGMFAMLRRYPVSAVMPYYVLLPIFGGIGGLIFFDEAPSGKFYVGAAITLLGVLLVNLFAKRRL